MDNESLDLLPIVSVIVPCYNEGRYLRDALNSVAKQSYYNWECIIVNDGSTDETEYIAQEYIQKDARFKYIAKKNGGLPGARNSGIKSAIGQYILPLDADDKIAVDYIKKGVEIFLNIPEIKLVYCKAEWFGLKTGNWPLKDYSYKELLLQNIIFCSCMYKKDDFEQVSGYDELMIKGYEDWDFLIKLLDVDDLVYRIDEILFFCRVKEKSSIFNSEKNEIDKRIYLFKKHIDKYLKFLPDPIFLAQENLILKNVYKNSFDYALGNFLVNPFRKILNSISGR